MFSTPTEFKKFSKEEAALSSFEQVWSKPLTEIIADINILNTLQIIQTLREAKDRDDAEARLANLPCALSPYHFHLRMRKNLETDSQAVASFVSQYVEQKSSAKKPVQDQKFDQEQVNDSLFSMVQSYLNCLADPKIVESSNELQDKLIEQCMDMQKQIAPDEYSADGDTRYRDLSFDPEFYFFISCLMDTFDIWSLRDDTDYYMFRNGSASDPPYFAMWQTLNPNNLYRNALYADSTCGNHRMGIDDRFRVTFHGRNPERAMQQANREAALKYYRGAVAGGLEVALTGMARMYAQGEGGVEQDVDFAFQLYNMAMQRGVIGAVPLNSDDYRILVISTLLSGMSLEGITSFQRATTLRGLGYIETEWLLKMNYANPTLRPILETFKKLSVENPDNVFDDLLDCIPGAAERLNLCLDAETVKLITQRKRTHFNDRAVVLAGTAGFSRGVSNVIFRFLGADNRYISADHSSEVENQQQPKPF